MRPAGTGATAVVWRGVHRDLGVPVAIKVMSLPANDRRSTPAARARQAQFRSLFAREVRAMASLDHPGIIRVHDHGTIDRDTAAASNGRLPIDAPYVVMDWVDGGTLADRQGELLWPEVRAIVFTLLDALAHAHARGVIHRDLKPRNVLMGERGPVLTDFGIVHQQRIDERNTSTVRAGTPGYMAPEQIDHDTRLFGPWTDLYALGCLAYEMVSGHLPFDPRGASTADSLLGSMAAEPSPLYPEIPVPEGFESWLHQLISHSPGKRFQFAADAARALATLAPPAGPEPRTLHWRRSPLVLTGIAEPRVGFADATLDEPLDADMDPDMTIKDGVMIFDGADRTVDEPADFDSVSSLSSVEGPVDADSFAPLKPRPDDPFEDVESTLDEAAARAAITWIDPSALINPVVAAHAGETTRPPIPQDWQRSETPAPVRLPGTGRALADLREPDLRGRQRERAVLWRMLGAVASDERPRAVIVSGGPGIGKTRLAQWLGARTHELGAAETMIATHTAAPGVSTGLSAMLARHTRAVGLEVESLVTHLRRVLDAPSALAGVAGAFLTRDRSLRVGAKTVTLWTEDEAFRGLTLVLQHVAARRALVVRIEDAQWGEEAVRFVEHVLARSPRLPALFVLTVRDNQSGRGPVQEALSRIAVRPSARTIRLGLLDAESQAALIDARIPLAPVTRAQVIEQAGGHPLFATELVCHWARSGALEPAADGYRLRSSAGNQPRNLDALWDARLSDVLGPFGRQTVEAFEVAAVLGNEVSAHEWQRACELASLDTDEVRWALERLLDGRLIQLVGAGRWAFTHGLLREALERRAARGQRRVKWHACCARMLRDQPDPNPSRLAGHLAESGRHAEALPLVMAQARDALDREDLSVLGRLVIEGARLAWRLRLSLDRSLIGIELRALWAWVATHTGMTTGRRHAERAVTDARKAGDRALEAHALAALGHLCRTQGDAVQATVHLRRAMTAARRAREPQLMARCSRQLCALLEATGRLDEAEAVLDAVERLVGIEGDPRERGLRRFRRASIALHRGQPREAYTHATAAREAFVDHGMRADVMQSENLLGEIARALDDRDAAGRHYRVAHDIARELGHSDAPLYAINRGRVLLEAGKFEEARSRFVIALREAARLDAWLATVLARASLLPCAAHARHWSSWDTQWACLGPLRTGRYVHRDVAAAARLAARLADKAGQRERAKLARGLALDQYQRLGMTRMVHMVRADAPRGG